MRHFPIIYLFITIIIIIIIIIIILSIYYYYYYFFFGGGSKLSIMIATLKENRMEQPPTHPPENKNKDELRKSQNMPWFIWGR